MIGAVLSGWTRLYCGNKRPNISWHIITLSTHQPWVSCPLLPVVLSQGLSRAASYVHDPVQATLTPSSFSQEVTPITAHVSLARASHVTMPESCMVMLFNLSAKSGAVISERLVMHCSTATLVSTEKAVRSPRAKAALRIPAPSASQSCLAQVLAQSHLRKHQPSEWLINGWMKYK